MRKGLFSLLLILSFSLVLGGCATYPPLSDDENKMVSNYAVSLLLKYDKENHSRLVDTSEFWNSYNEALAIREAKIAEIEAQKKAEEEAQKKEQEKEEEIIDDGTGGATVIESKWDNVSIESVLNASGFSINYSGCSFADIYPERKLDLVAPMTASRGYDIMVVHFNVTNNSGASAKLNVYMEGARFKLSINDGGLVSCSETMYEEDLSEYFGNFAEGETKDLVLLCEVKEGTSVDSLGLNINSPSNGTFNIRLQ